MSRLHETVQAIRAELELTEGQYALTREFYLPKEVRGKEPVDAQGTDLSIWTYEAAETAKGPRFLAIAFQGKQSKPLWHVSFRTEDARDKQIQQTIDSRKKSLAFKEQDKKDRSFDSLKTPVKPGDLFYSSWGYDQTNIEYFQVVEVKGKYAILREVAQKTKGDAGGPQAEMVVPVPDKFIGQPERHLIQVYKGEPHFTLDSVRSASPWDGRPHSQTAFGYGH
jgi:hypothetical protein